MWHLLLSCLIACLCKAVLIVQYHLIFIVYFGVDPILDAQPLFQKSVTDIWLLIYGY